MKCLQCGKEIPEGRKFCSSSCSAKYNNVRRERKPWTEEQKERISVERVNQVCRFCGKDVERVVLPSAQYRGCCSECKQYLPRLRTIQALGYVKGQPLKEAFFVGIKNLQDEYANGESLLTLSKKYGIDKATVARCLGPKIRSFSEAAKVALEQKRLIPEWGYKAGTHTSWEGKVFQYRSSWEEKLMKEFDREHKKYEYEPFTIRYWDSTLGKERIAIPDFYLPETRELIELKSSWTLKGRVQELRDKFSRYRELGYTPKLILDWSEQDIESIEDL